MCSDMGGLSQRSHRPSRTKKRSCRSWRPETGRRDHTMMVKRVLRSESLAALVALLAVVILFTAIDSRFVTLLNIEGIIVSASISAVVGLGMTFVVAMRSLDLSVGSTMGFAAIMTGTLLSAGLPLPAVVLAGVLSAAALGLANGLLIVLLRLPSFVA